MFRFVFYVTLCVMVILVTLAVFMVTLEWVTTRIAEH
jgi:hypothetical protein